MLSHGPRQAHVWLIFDVGRKMKFIVSIAVGVLLFTTGCGWVRYMHPVVAERNGVRVIDRSRDSTSSQGKPLSGAKIGLPTKSVITRGDYTIEIRTPINPLPVMFLRAHSSKGDELRLKGAHLHELDNRSGGWLEGDRYTFYLDAAKGAPLQFEVVTPTSALLGREKVEYEMISRGRIWTFDGI